MSTVSHRGLTPRRSKSHLRQSERLGHPQGPKRAKLHRAATAKRSASGPIRIGDLLDLCARRLRRAGVFFGHGTENARDEAAALVFHAARISHEMGAAAYSKPVDDRALRRAHALVERRIAERIPAVYLTRETWFAGLPFYVDPRVLIPRSPLAELIERRFVPWIKPSEVHRVLDIGTGSGCIAIACAKAFPRARVDAVDVSKEALDVARINVRRHRVAARTRLVESDHFSALGRRTYDIIVSNPPYVGARALRDLPAEYRHEPRIALAAGVSGLDCVRVILREAGRHLRPHGVLVVEVGDNQSALQRAFPRLPFLWLQFARGGGPVFLLTAEQLPRDPRDVR